MDALQKVIEAKIRPLLQSHDGDIELVEVTAEGFVKVRLTGACAACPGAQQTLSEVVETEIRQACPEIKGVVLVMQVDQELIDIALKMLRKDKKSDEGLH